METIIRHIYVTLIISFVKHNTFYKFQCISARHRAIKYSTTTTTTGATRDQEANLIQYLRAVDTIVKQIIVQTF